MNRLKFPSIFSQIPFHLRQAFQRAIAQGKERLTMILYTVAICRCLENMI